MPTCEGGVLLPLSTPPRVLRDFPLTKYDPEVRVFSLCLPPLAAHLTPLPIALPHRMASRHLLRLTAAITCASIAARPKSEVCVA
jgi:hypothetical protein